MRCTKENPGFDYSCGSGGSIDGERRRSLMAAKDTDQLPKPRRARMETRSTDDFASHALEKHRRSVSVAPWGQQDNERSEEQSRGNSQVNSLRVSENHPPKGISAQRYHPAVRQHQVDAQQAAVKAAEKAKEKVY